MPSNFKRARTVHAYRKSLLKCQVSNLIVKSRVLSLKSKLKSCINITRVVACLRNRVPQPSQLMTNDALSDNWKLIFKFLPTGKYVSLLNTTQLNSH